MPSKFRSASTASTAETFYRIYDLVVNTTSQSIYRLVNDTGSAVALYNGSTFVSSFANAAAVAAGSYMVIEPVTALGGRRHQIRINNTGTTVNSVQFSSRGGWTNAGAAFGSSSATSATQFNDGAAPGAGSTVIMGMGTFAIDGSNTGTYFWANIRDSGSAAADQFTYAGNYYPWSISYDVNPVCLLARVPTISAASVDLGRNSADANCLNRTSVEVAQTTSLVSAGYARIGSNDTPATPGTTCIWRDLQSYYPPLPAYLFLRNSAIMGHFGDHLRLINGALTDYDTGTTAAPATRLIIGDLWLHYDETL